MRSICRRSAGIEAGRGMGGTVEALPCGSRAFAMRGGVPSRRRTRRRVENASISPRTRSASSGWRQTTSGSRRNHVRWRLAKRRVASTIAATRRRRASRAPRRRRASRDSRRCAQPGASSRIARARAAPRTSSRKPGGDHRVRAGRDARVELGAAARRGRSRARRTAARRSRAPPASRTAAGRSRAPPRARARCAPRRAGGCARPPRDRARARRAVQRGDARARPPARAARRAARGARGGAGQRPRRSDADVEPGAADDQRRPPARVRCRRCAARGRRAEARGVEGVVGLDQVEAVVRHARALRRRSASPCRCRGRGRPGASRPRRSRAPSALGELEGERASCPLAVGPTRQTMRGAASSRWKSASSCARDSSTATGRPCGQCAFDVDRRPSPRGARAPARGVEPLPDAHRAVAGDASRAPRRRRARRRALAPSLGELARERAHAARPTSRPRSRRGTVRRRNVPSPNGSPSRPAAASVALVLGERRAARAGGSVDRLGHEQRVARDAAARARSARRRSKTHALVRRVLVDQHDAVRRPRRAGSRRRPGRRSGARRSPSRRRAARGAPAPPAAGGRAADASAAPSGAAQRLEPAAPPHAARRRSRRRGRRPGAARAPSAQPRARSAGTIELVHGAAAAGSAPRASRDARSRRPRPAATPRKSTATG